MGTIVWDNGDRDLLAIWTRRFCVKNFLPFPHLKDFLKKRFFQKRWGGQKIYEIWTFPLLTVRIRSASSFTQRASLRQNIEAAIFTVLPDSRVVQQNNIYFHEAFYVQYLN